MALNWNVEKIKDYKDVCWIGEGENRQMNPVTHALIFNSIAIDMGEITADNAAEVFARTSIMERVNGALLTIGGEDTYLTMEDIQAHIGLWTNVSFQPRSKWAMRWFVGHGDYLVKYGTKRKSPEEVERAEDRLEGVDVSRTEDYARQYRQFVKGKIMNALKEAGKS